MMTDQLAIEIAKHIREDREGANYYNDPDVLAPYLQSSLNISEETSRKVAQHIKEDRDGADYYKEVKVLSKYLEGFLVT